jgi:hypothetical protein
MSSSKLASSQTSSAREKAKVYEQPSRTASPN